MASLATTLKEEISRLARKEVRSAMTEMKKNNTAQQREIVTLQRRVDAQQKKIDALKSGGAGGRTPTKAARGGTTRKTTAAAGDSDATARSYFSAKGLKSHRKKLGLAAKDYAKLVGVSPLTIYNWENEKSKPRQAQFESLSNVRDMGKREAQRKLEEINADNQQNQTQAPAADAT